MNIQNKLKKMKPEILALAKKYGASNLRIFGSVARGDDREDSDIDFLIQLAPNRSLFDIIGLKQDLEDLLGHRVDIVTEASLSPYLREDIIKSAMNL